MITENADLLDKIEASLAKDKMFECAGLHLAALFAILNFLMAKRAGE